MKHFQKFYPGWAISGGGRKNDVSINPLNEIEEQ